MSTALTSYRVWADGTVQDYAADVATAAAQGFRDGVAAWDAAKKAKDTI